LRDIATIAFFAGLLSSSAIAAPIALTDGQLNAVVAGTRFTVTNQVSDQASVGATTTDPLLVNAWGLAQGAPGAPLWVADNGTDKSTLYSPMNFSKVNLNVDVPGGPTGTTFINIANAFKVTQGAASGQSAFAFATEAGQILGWSPAVNLNAAVVAVNESAQGSEFKGLTLGMANGQPRLFAADFGHNRVSVYDSNFTRINTFTDPSLPSDYSPFNVQVLNGLLYVTFAKHEPGSGDETQGQGLGFVDVFDTSGNLIRRLAQHGQLNAPWGLAIAPNAPSYGKFAGALLVGNFGDGHINAYDPQTGNYIGALRDDQNWVVIDGLWAIHSGLNDTLIISAGPNDESHGLIGSISVATGFGGDEVASMAEMHGNGH
jgi:uncharacterized protein (TIGR03118 family)